MLLLLWTKAATYIKMVLKLKLGKFSLIKELKHIQYMIIWNITFIP